MRILLVEPSYKNKYPPLGLMKISSYHKYKGDSVLFVKGIVHDLPYEYYDRIYITTLFTFYYDITAKTIRYYKKYIRKIDDIYVGGIMSSLMAKELKESTGVNNIIQGLLVNSKIIGFKDNVNIDILTPDYSILNHIEYQYPASNSYFAYTTRGCPNKCKFCAVPILEPKFITTNNIEKQINEIDIRFGKKRNLLLLDNNILFSPQLAKIIKSIQKAGFTKNAKYIEQHPYEIFINSYKKHTQDNNEISNTIHSLISFKNRIKNQNDKLFYNDTLTQILECKSKSRKLYSLRRTILPVILKYKNKVPKKRYVDFNQGLDADLITDSTIKLLSEIPIKPLRIAFDNWGDNMKYSKAVKLVAQYGIREVSNYLLYNFTDKPEDLWKRISLNTQLRQELGINIFSFPMKYSPVNETNRLYIGKYWNKKYLRAIQLVLLAKHGIVSSNKSFIEKAFGKTENEFKKILSMPEPFIIYRLYYETNGLACEWEYLFDSLSESEKIDLLSILNSGSLHLSFLGSKSRNIKKILEYYTIKHLETNSNRNTLNNRSK